MVIDFKSLTLYFLKMIDEYLILANIYYRKRMREKNRLYDKINETLICIQFHHPVRHVKQKQLVSS